ncbi:DROSHA [Cordylochernes scorpioides]|uniref:DROSHA n=1 Tax=Cordylochernes scorpioides TaxID=51811 RepID=A0ABY6KXS0_9ARAC|nr:DROSHA [Cordylochernes scorpioides]
MAPDSCKSPTPPASASNQTGLWHILACGAAGGGKELLSMHRVLEYLIQVSTPLVPDEAACYSEARWQDHVDEARGSIVTKPGLKPSSLRVDQLDRDNSEVPEIVHFGKRPPQLNYAGNPAYQKAWREYVKFRHLLANKTKVGSKDRHRLELKEEKLQDMRMKRCHKVRMCVYSSLKRDVTIVLSSDGFYKTGIRCDIVQHALLLPVLICHLRFHDSLSVLEENIGHSFKDRSLIQLALTHPSYRENFGTNPDHIRNSLTNCGIRQPEYGDRRIHYLNTRKRGINMLIHIMSRLGCSTETSSRINHNERLEFLGDAVVEFLSSIHLFFLFPDLEEGGLATFRAALVQNQHLALLARRLEVERFMLYAHGSDLCHDLELQHATANCMEALMVGDSALLLPGALFLDDGLQTADNVFSKILFEEKELVEIWKQMPKHPLQVLTDNWSRAVDGMTPECVVQKLVEFEELTGIEFNHIRLLARAFTHRSIGYNNLTLGSNQRLEFLGDTVLQLIASEYLYKFFPDHHEGHLSVSPTQGNSTLITHFIWIWFYYLEIMLKKINCVCWGMLLEWVSIWRQLLRSSLVNNRTQGVVCDDLGLAKFAIFPQPKVELKAKDRADLMEAFIGALYVDQGLEACRTFCQVCFFPRLQDFILYQEWNDPKSKLQQCCLTLRTMEGGEPDIPVYK